MQKVSDRKRIIVALDTANAKQALELADKLDPACCRVKVGKELFASAGPSIVQALQTRGFEVFLDLKFHDIPNTVASACKVAADLGVWMMNVHASGGRRMMESAREAIGLPGPGVPLLIGVTVLTSMDSDELLSVGVNRPIEAQVLALAQSARQSGLDGVVCSAREASMLSVEIPGQILVTPGIRVASDSADDQRRITTPEQAVGNGASYLVIGRSVTAAADPVARLKSINDSLLVS